MTVPTTLVLVCGMPGAGKTTLAVDLAQRYGAIRLCPDEWLIPLRLDPHDAALRDRRERLQWGQARELLALGTSVVLEFGFWARGQRELKRRVARTRGVRVELHVLDVDLDERWRRIARRNGGLGSVQITREQLESYQRYWQPPTDDELTRFDPPTERPARVVPRVVARWPRRRRRGVDRPRLTQDPDHQTCPGGFMISTTPATSGSRTFTRRGFVALSAAATAAAYGVSAAPAWAAPTFASTPFTLGIASGDPLPDGVVLWTRLAPEPLAPDGLGGMPAKVVEVRWEVASDPSFRRVVRRGVERAVPELAHSVHAEVSGLGSGRDYWFRFTVGREVSRVGHTKTAPAAGSMPQQITFALASCQAWSGGRFAAYRAMARESLDLVVHVGDYTYERADDETLADFRTNHAKYKTSPDLQDAHAAAAFVVAFDDHEIENNWAANVSQPDGEASNEPGRFRRLRANAFQAYYEHLPLRRPQRPNGASIRLHRRLDYGRLARFHVLDTRQYRTDQLTEAFPGGPLDPRASDPGTSLLGDAQERWLFAGLRDSPARWNVLAQQTIMAQVDYDLGEGVSVNHDQWDGYRVSRERFLSYVDRTETANPVVLSGDWHSAWVNDLRLDFDRPESPAVATEFVSTSISSGCGWADAVEQARPANPHVRYLNARQRGYVSVRVTPGQWYSDYRVVTSAADTADPAVTDSSWVVEDGRPGAQSA